MTESSVTEQLRCWRLMLGNQEDGTGCTLGETDLEIDQTLSALYDPDSGEKRKRGLGASSPKVACWLGDIRNYFPTSVVQVMQRTRWNDLICERCCFSRKCSIDRA